jgi:uncharacterized protein
MDLRDQLALSPVESGYPVTAVTLNLTTRCNFGCLYCFSGCFKEYEGQDMTEAMAFQIVDWLLAPSTRGDAERVDIGFWGGEPLLKWDLLQAIVEYAEARAKEQDVLVTFGGTTNVSLLTEDKFDYMDRHGIHFLLSCDGVQRHHDQFRKFKNGTGSWQIVDARLTAIIKRWPGQEIRLSFTADNVHELREDIDYFIAKGFTNIIYSPVSEGDWTEERLEALRQTWTAVAEWYAGQDRIHLKFIDDACGHICSQPVGDSAPCGAGRGYLGINHDGSLYPCVPPESYVETDQGPRQIRDINEYDQVLTHTGRHKTVTKVWKKLYHGPLHSLETELFPASQFTPEHPVYAIGEDDFGGASLGWIEAKDIQAGDELVIPIYHNPDMSRMQEARVLGAKPNKRILFLLGRCLSPARGGRDPFMIQTDSFIERGDLRRALKELGLTPRKYRNGCIGFTSEAFGAWLDESVWLNWRSETRLPPWIMDLDKDHIKAFLRGLFWQGSCQPYSRKMAEQVKTLVLRLGEFPFLTFEKSAPFEYWQIVRKPTAAHARIAGGKLYLRVLKNTTASYHGNVYNLEVKDDNSYVLSNVTAHNCHRFCKFEDQRPWQAQEVCLGHVDHGILNHSWRDRFVDWQPNTDCPPACQACEAFKITCTGGCWATNYDASGDIAQSPRVNCETARATLDQARLVLEQRPPPAVNILPEVQGCQCYNVEDRLYGRYKMNQHEPYRCLCNMTSYGDAPKPVRSCTCYNVENNGRGYFDQEKTCTSSETCETCTRQESEDPAAGGLAPQSGA